MNEQNTDVDINIRELAVFIVLGFIVIAIFWHIGTSEFATENNIEINMIDEPSDTTNLVKYEDLDYEEQQIFREISHSSQSTEYEFSNVEYIYLDGNYYEISEKEIMSIIGFMSVSILIVTLVITILMSFIFLSELYMNHKNLFVIFIILICLMAIYFVYPPGSESIMLSEEPVKESTDNYINLTDMPEEYQQKINSIIVGGEYIDKEVANYNIITSDIKNTNLTDYDYVKTNNEYYDIKYSNESYKSGQTIVIIILNIIILILTLYIINNLRNKLKNNKL